MAEREYRQRTRPIISPYDVVVDRVSEEVKLPVPGTAATVTVENRHSTVAAAPPHKMGFYDNDGDYHSFRRGAQRVAERVLHPVHGSSHHGHGHHDERDEGVMRTERVRVVERAIPANTVTIPCHHIRLGDLLMLQGRPCQVIRISTSAATGQHRYLGVDLFTKQLHEESSFTSHPGPSVVVQNMLGPVFKQYRVLDMRGDGTVVAMTESGDVKQGLLVIDQSGLYERLADAFDNGRGSVRVLVLADRGQELAVDYKIVHGSRL